MTVTYAPATHECASFEELTDAMISQQEHANRAFFAQGDYLLANATEGQLPRMGCKNRASLLRNVGDKTGYSKRLLEYRWQVSDTFPNALIAKGPYAGTVLRELPIRWSVYLEAAQSSDPVYWAVRAADEGLTRAKLKAAIERAGDQELPEYTLVYPLKNTPVEVAHVSDDGTEVTFRLPAPLSEDAREQLRTARAWQVTAAGEVDSATVAQRSE